MKYIYLACPFKADGNMTEQTRKRIEDSRVASATFAAFRIMRDTGQAVFSPITYSQKFRDMGVNFTHDEWLAMDQKFLLEAEKMIVLRIQGWKDSDGVQRELQWCKEWGIPVEYIDE